jgi:NAD(P)H-dependent flavin oxidoreductase YrpB (nitropropane dioxygenase family)
MTGSAPRPVGIAGQPLPPIIQGGMGIGVSGWRLARAVSRRGQLGVVSGTAIDSVLVRRLQDGDPGGQVRRAMEAFPIAGVAAGVLSRYFRPDGRPPGTPYQLLPMYRHVVHKSREALTTLAAFVEVFLAREGHNGLVGINLLTKVQRPNIATLYGAMLAGVDVVLMGAGIPREIPAVLEALAVHQPASLRLDVVGGSSDEVIRITLDPGVFWTELPPALHRPRFLPIVASNSLATMLVRKVGAGIDGLIIEGPTAGGHNAPPRGEPHFNSRGEPSYGPRDDVDLAKLKELGVPFWVAGGAGSPAALRAARNAGAAGIQVGTLFAYADESGLRADLKAAVLAHVAHHDVDVFTDPLASPTGYPFKVVSWPGAPDVSHRSRICDLGYLRVVCPRADGRLEFRCAAEPVDAFVQKGGDAAETVGRRCLCNALMANIGLAQVREDGTEEPPLLTSGDDLATMSAFLAGRTRYTAADVLAYLLDE